MGTLKTLLRDPSNGYTTTRPLPAPPVTTATNGQAPAAASRNGAANGVARPVPSGPVFKVYLSLPHMISMFL
jgi:hypothetical protein